MEASLGEGPILGAPEDEEELREAHVHPDGEPERDLPASEAGEWPFEVELLDLSELIVDHTYQRPVEERFVKAMAESFDETLVGCLDVSDRQDGTYAILDGQQRFEAMKSVGKTTCFASTFTDMTIQDEAGFFYRKNRDRRAMKGYFGFRARVIAGDPTANEIEEAVHAAGFSLGPSSDHTDVVGAVLACERAWALTSDVRRDCLTPALRTIAAAWRGRDESLRGSVIGGLARFWRAYADSEVEWDLLIRALQGEINGPKNFLGLARERQVGPGGLTRAAASVVAWGYNRVLPESAETLDVERIS